MKNFKYAKNSTENNMSLKHVRAADQPLTRNTLKLNTLW